MSQRRAFSANLASSAIGPVRHTLCEVPHDQISRTCWIDLMLELNMPVGAIDVSDQISELERLAAVIFSRYRSQLRELRLEVSAEGIILRGRSATFYGKQLALHEALRCGLPVVANDIVVAASSCTAVMA